MGGTSGIAALAQVVPTTHGVDEQIDWRELEKIWGTRFPADYVDFMEVYGAGELSSDGHLLGRVGTEERDGERPRHLGDVRRQGGPRHGR